MRGERVVVFIEEDRLLRRRSAGLLEMRLVVEADADDLGRIREEPAEGDFRFVKERRLRLGLARRGLDERIERWRVTDDKQFFERRRRLHIEERYRLADVEHATRRLDAQRLAAVGLLDGEKRDAVRQGVRAVVGPAQRCCGILRLGASGGDRRDGGKPGGFHQMTASRHRFLLSVVPGETPSRGGVGRPGTV